MPMPENNLKIQENSLASGNTDKNKKGRDLAPYESKGKWETKNPTASLRFIGKIISRNTWADKWINNMWCSCS